MMKVIWAEYFHLNQLLIIADVRDAGEYFFWSANFNV